MELEEKDLTQSKDTKKRLELHQYEAILNHVKFEMLGSDIEDAKQHLILWLNEHTNGYTIADLYLKNKDPWA